MSYNEKKTVGDDHLRLKNKNTLVSVILMASVLFFCVFCFWDASGTGSAASDETILLSDMKGGFRLISFDSKKYTVYRISDNGKKELFSDSIPLRNAYVSGESLVLEAESRDYPEYIVCNMKTNKRNVEFPDTKKIRSGCTAVDQKGNLYYVSEDSPRNVTAIIGSRGATSGYSLHSDPDFLFTDPRSGNVFAVTDHGVTDVVNGRDISCPVPGREYEFNGKYCCDSTGNVYEFDSSSGFQRIMSVKYKTFCCAEGVVYGASGNVVYRLSADGTPEASCETGSEITSLSASAGKIACCNYDDEMTILDRSGFVRMPAEESGQEKDKKPESKKENSEGQTSRRENSSGSSGKNSSSEASPESNDEKIYDLKSDTLVIKDGLIIGITQGTTVAGIKKSIEYGDCDLEVYNHHGKKTVSGQVGTGWTFIFSGGGQRYELKTVVAGDLTGEGNINMNDVNRFADWILSGSSELAPEIKTAADLDGNGRAWLEDIRVLFNMVSAE